MDLGYYILRFFTAIGVIAFAYGLISGLMYWNSVLEAWKENKNYKDEYEKLRELQNITRWCTCRDCLNEHKIITQVNRSI